MIIQNICFHGEIRKKIRLSVSSVDNEFLFTFMHFPAF